MSELTKALNIADLNYNPLTWDDRHSTVEAAFTELARLQAIEAAAGAYLQETRYFRPRLAKSQMMAYDALKDALERKP